MKSKMLGGMLLIVGTSIGGGMLALPIVTAQAGFVAASSMLIFSWAVMTFCAFLLLEVNMWMPMNSNLILMVKNTLGKGAAGVAWLCYLALFYCLLAAYISGGSDILHGILQALHIPLSVGMNAVLFTVLLGAIVYKGIRAIDYANRILMVIKMLAFILLVLFISPHVDVTHYQEGHFKYIAPAFTVLITSYGFSTIIPSLRGYFNNDIRQLRKVILIGSCIPLACYIAWVAVIFGSIPYAGEFSLTSIATADHSTLALTEALIHQLHNSSITLFTQTFTSICVATSFLGVSLCVVDFLSDGLQIEKKGVGEVFLHALTFLPPFVIALLFPDAFVAGLSYAGICIAILIILFPTLMVWKGRYQLKIAADYRVMGGKLPLVVTMIVAVAIILQGFILHP